MPRDLTILIDTSGSMSGRPLTQAKRVVALLIETLGIEDRLELIEFSNAPRSWSEAPSVASETNKQDALRWVRNLRASGCTEMHTALVAALTPLRDDSQRQVVLVTDGCIGFEREITAALLKDLPGQARLHTVGVGSGVNRSLTRAAARAGRGTELILGADENPDKLVYRLLARTAAPLVTELRVEGADLVGVAPRALPDLYAESPALIAIRARAGAREVVLRGHTAGGEFVQRLAIPALERGMGQAGVTALFARESVEDLETALTAGGDRAELNRAIEATGIGFQISTRLTSWIAVSQAQTVDPEARKRAVEQPHNLPHAVSAEGLGLRKPQQAAPSGYADGSPAPAKVGGARRRGAMPLAPRLRTSKRPKKREFDDLKQEQRTPEPNEKLIQEDSAAGSSVRLSGRGGGGIREAHEPDTSERLKQRAAKPAPEPSDEEFRAISRRDSTEPEGLSGGAPLASPSSRLREEQPGASWDDEDDSSAEGAQAAAPESKPGATFTGAPLDAEKDEQKLTRSGSLLDPEGFARMRAQHEARRAKESKASRWRTVVVLLALIALALAILAGAMGLWGVGPQ